MPNATDTRARNPQPLLTTFLGLIALINIVFPQPALAQTHSSDLRSSPEAICLSVREELTDQSPSGQLPEISLRPAKRTTWLTVTAYSSTVDQTDNDPFTTASGSTVHDGTLAHNFLPFGTQVRFPDIFGDKIFIVEDRLNARYGPFMADIWMETRDQAIQWGARVIRMEIL